mgnify:CR=1 FL=1
MLHDALASRGIVMEYTAPHTPQQNGVVERRFVIDRKRAMAMMYAAGFDQHLQQKLWAEAVKTAALLDNLLVTPKRPVCPHEMFYGSPLKLYPYLIQFGRIGYITI